MISIIIYCIREAKVFEEYAKAINSGVMLSILAFQFFIFTWKSSHFFIFMEKFENIVKKSCFHLNKRISKPK